MTEAQFPNDVQHDNSLATVEYINGLLPLISNTALLNKAEQILDNPNEFSLLYYEMFPKNRTVNKRLIPPVKARVCRHCGQCSIVYNFLQRLYIHSPKSVAEKVLDSNLSYERLVAEFLFRQGLFA